MDLIPDLALLEVFSFVRIEERFGKLRLVCRRWKQVVEFQIQKDLVVYENEFPFKTRWSSDHRQTDHLNTVAKPFFDFYLINDHHKAIKRLFFYRINLANFEAKLMAKLLECVCQLEELSIDQPKLEAIFAILSQEVREKENWSFNLDGLTFPDLKVLRVKQMFKAKASITSPRLEKLVLCDLDFIHNRSIGPVLALSHPERLKFLQCQQVNKETGVFRNLEQLSVQDVNLGFSLSHHGKLKRLDLCTSSHETIEELIKQRRKLNLDLEITNFGVKDDVTSTRNRVRNVNSICFQFYGGLDHLVKNFAIDYLPWTVQFYSAFYLNFKGLSELCRSRITIEIVIAKKDWQPDPDLLIKFLVEIGGVRRLIIHRCLFDQNFYNQLEKVPYIGSLDIQTPAQAIDFEFIYRIKFLNRICLNVKPHVLDSFCEGFKRSKIRILSICVSEGLFTCRPILEVIRRNNRISISSKKLVEFSKLDEKRFEFDNLNDALGTLKKEFDL